MEPVLTRVIFPATVMPPVIPVPELVMFPKLELVRSPANVLVIEAAVNLIEFVRLPPFSVTPPITLTAPAFTRLAGGAFTVMAASTATGLFKPSLRVIDVVVPVPPTMLVTLC